MRIDGTNYFDPKNSLFPYSEDGRLGVAISVLLGKKRLADLTHWDCVALGYEQEECRLLDQEVTADVVRRHCTEQEIRDMAESMIGTLLYNLMTKCDQLEERCDALDKQVAELESNTPITQGI